MYNRVLKKYNNVYVTEHGVLFTENAVIEESYIFPDHSNKFSRSFLQKTKQKRNTKKIKSENNLVLFNYWSTNYFHWLADDLVRLQALLDNFKTSRFSVFIPKDAPLFIFDSLKHFNVNVEVFKTNEVLFFNNVFYTNTLSPSGLIHPKFLDVVKKIKSKVNTGNRKLYISRNNSQVRKILNENELIPLLKKHNFEIVQCENLSFDMQVELFCNAKIVIGPHGAGLTNTCFMEKGTVIEIGSEDINPCFANMSSLVGSDHHYFLCSVSENNCFYLTKENLEQIDGLLEKC